VAARERVQPQSARSSPKDRLVLRSLAFVPHVTHVMDGPLEGGRAGCRSPGYRQAAYRGGSSPPGATRHKWPFGCDTDGQLPEHQHVAVGDLICDRPNYAWYFRVQRVDPQRPLVYRSIRHPRRGSAIDITGPHSPRQAEQRLPEAGAYIDFAGALAPGR